MEAKYRGRFADRFPNGYFNTRTSNGNQQWPRYFGETDALPPIIYIRAPAPNQRGTYTGYSPTYAMWADRSKNPY